MATRNFWIEAFVDGRRRPLMGGPKAKDGGFQLVIYMREKGEAVRVLDVFGYCDEDEEGKLSRLVLEVQRSDTWEHDRDVLRIEKQR